MSKKENNEDNKTRYLPIGMCVGVGVGMCIGSATGNIAIGMCTGLSIGMCIGAIIDHINNKKSDNDSSK